MSHAKNAGDFIFLDFPDFDKSGGGEYLCCTKHEVIQWFTVQVVKFARVDFRFCTCADHALTLRFSTYIETSMPHESWAGEVTTEHLDSELQTWFRTIESRYGVDGGVLLCTLTEVYNVPGCNVNLFSVNALEENG
ncbi:hypothetical protein PHMEG_00020462 [Phytophthora megakarya]|uniref:Uncharacterized protein n=1 Tax=Phytophthora megakarya TaxID=4795 RepID=A0A225VNQ5_9STRA|nr:hypothetical protein PHMEG_00020462 [Phytophthora megakarya]